MRIRIRYANTLVKLIATPSLSLYVSLRGSYNEKKAVGYVMIQWWGVLRLTITSLSDEKSLTEMFPGAEKFFLDIRTKQFFPAAIFFSWHKNFFLT